MSEKRFKSTLDEETMSVMPYLVSDKEEEYFYNLQDCVDLLNEQQDTIERLNEENEQLRQFINKGRRLSVKELIDNANENELLKKKIRELESILANDIALRYEIKDAWKQRTEKRW